MKVNRPDIINLINKISKREKASKTDRSSPARDNASKSEQVEFSTTVEAFKKEMAKLEKTDQARLQKLDELTRQIETGEYKVDSRELADIICKEIESQE